MMKLGRNLALTTALSIGALAMVGCETTATPSKSSMVSSSKAAQAVTPMPSKALPETLTRIAFGSCLSEKEDQSIWATIAAEKPDAFIFMGDNIYGDAYRSDPLFSDPSMPKMRSSYNKLASHQEFANFRAQVPVMPIWDDHDYGANDGGADYLFKDQAKELFLDAWAIPQNDIRRKRDGVYTSQIIGEAGKRVQVILLDTRSFRTYLQATDKRNAPGKERYVPLESDNGTLLGEAQWDWLQGELQKPADLRLLVSSIQVIADGHGWEAWRTMPAERERLYNMITQTGANDVLMLSGDRHAGAFYKREGVAPYTLHEFTSSSLNLPASKWRAESGETRIEDGPYRTTTMQFDVNYGLMDIDWEKRQAKVRLVSPGNDSFVETVEF
ncbi:alkaline phosphatase D family protein [Hellea balneolensis]|uniref:alkaline phosphatase D family protein n=1 Tax=Hellea balneolensis TaxID=287478 RepID=UPI0003F8B289|nr:alkaline phosphatase D family protein [Hellea balneolensis]